MAQGFQALLLCRDQHVGQFGRHALDARGEFPFGVYRRKTELDVGVDAQCILIRPVVGQGVVEVSDGVDHHLVGQVLRAVLMDDVHHDRHGEHLPGSGVALQKAVEDAVIARGILLSMEGMEGVKSAEMLGVGTERQQAQGQGGGQGDVHGEKK